jgi:hypothetical protein
MRLWKSHVASEKHRVVCVDPESVSVERRKLRVLAKKELK